MMQFELNQKRLFECASQDETRYHLCAVHYTGEEWVSTDGHRMMVIPDGEVVTCGRKKAGETYEAKAFRVDALAPMSDVKYPAWKQLTPDVSKAAYVIETSIPAWFGRVSHKVKRGEMPTIGLDRLGHWTLGNDRLFTVNVGYLAVLAGESVRISVIDEISPIRFESVEKNQAWYYILMPMRNGKGIETKVIKEPKAAMEVVS